MLVVVGLAFHLNPKPVIVALPGGATLGDVMRAKLGDLAPAASSDEKSDD